MVIFLLLTPYGFSISKGTASPDNTNGSAKNYVAWAWKAGGSGGGLSFWKDGTGYSTASAAGLTAGTITPTGASVNTKSGFSIITFNESSSSPTTLSHGLNSSPAFMIWKQRNGAGNWIVYHQSLGNTQYLTLQTTNTATTSSAIWNNTTPTSSVITFGSNFVGGASTNDVLYCWAEIPGFSKFGSYTGNGSADGPVVITGFKPAFIMIRGSSFISNWFIQDNRRNGYNPNSGVALRPNLTNQEDGTTTYDIDILSNGFKLRSSAGDSNTSTATFIYAAFAETPSINLYGAQANAR